MAFGKRRDIEIRKIIGLVLAGVLLCRAAHTQGAYEYETIKVGFFEIKPHAYVDEKNFSASGASVNYLNDIAEQLGYRISWEGPVPFPRLVEKLKRSEIDCAIVFTHNKAREQFVAYPTKPYYHVRPIIAVNASNPLRAVKKIEDIQGYDVGYLAGGNMSPIIKNNLAKINLQLIPGEQWVEQNILKLINGRIDAIYDLNQNTMLYSATLLGVQEQIKIITLPEKSMPLYVVFAKSSQKSQKFFDDYNSYVTKNDINYSAYIDKILSEIQK